MKISKNKFSPFGPFENSFTLDVFISHGRVTHANEPATHLMDSVCL